MKSSTPNAKIIAKIQNLHAASQQPVVIAIDGGSGAGKSTLAFSLARDLEAALVPLDDFFAAQIPDHHWDTFSIEERLQRVFDWPCLRAQVLEPLRDRQPAQWYAFDFVAGLRPDGTYDLETTPKTLEPAKIILLDGTYSAAAPLADLVDFSILLDVPVPVRHTRTAAREDAAFLKRWHLLWNPVEDYYFNTLKPGTTFDLVVPYTQA